MLLKQPLKKIILVACLHALSVLLSPVVASTTTSNTDQNPPEQITVLYLMGEQAPLEWHQSFRRGFKENLTTYINDFNVNEITHSMHRSISFLSLDEQLKSLEDKFAGSEINYIISDVSSTQGTIDQHPDFLPFAKRIFFSQNSIGTKDIVEISENRSLVRVSQRYKASIENMLHVAKPKRVHVFGDLDTRFGRERAELVKKAVDQINSDVPFSYYLNEDTKEMRQIAANIPTDEAIYYLIVQRDSDGTIYTPMDALRLIEQDNKAPIFSHWEPMVRHGVIGGYVVSAEAMGKAAVDFIASYQKNSLPSINTDTLFEHIFDDREVFEYGFSKARFDNNARILFPQKGYLEHHLNEIITLSIAAIVLLILVSITLYQRVKNREKALEDARIVAVNANEAKTQFLANMSHELRTPVNAILGITSVLKDSPDQSSESAAQLGLVHRSALKFINMLNEVLDLNKVQSRELELAPEAFNLAQLCNDAAALFTPRAQAKGIDINKAFDCDQWVFADSLRLRQIITNLLGNAIKFTDEGAVTFSCHVQSIESKVNLTLKIEDTGIGIAKEDLPTIFERFTQVDTSIARRFSGTGLGLAIVHELTELFGGQIQVESEQGKGTCFTLNFEFDAADAVVADVTTPTETQPASENLTILVVDDVETNRMVASIILKKMGHTPLTAERGKEAIGMLGNRDDIDLVLMDLQMPELDGYETTRLLRESGFSKPIIALSANAQQKVDEACLAAGMNGYASKPIDIHGLQQLLDNVYPPLKAQA